jgi:hypothetical protein
VYICSVQLCVTGIPPRLAARPQPPPQPARPAFEATLFSFECFQHGSCDTRCPGRHVFAEGDFGALANHPGLGGHRKLAASMKASPRGRAAISATSLAVPVGLLHINENGMQQNDSAALV